MTDLTTTHQLPYVDIASVFDVKQIETYKYRGIKPLQKQSSLHRGVFGGNFVAQSLLVAIRSAPHGFQPHTIHSYFVRAGDDRTPIEWEVDEISNGRTFANRAIRGFQNGKVVFTANVSLTSKNSAKDIAKKTSTTPLIYQKEVDSEYHDLRNSITKCPLFLENANAHFTVRTFPINLSRDIYAFLLRFGAESKETIVGLSTEYQYVALATISDFVRLEEVFKSMGVEVDVSFNVSLDHSIYFHDNDFDATKWSTYLVEVTRWSHDRVMIVGKIYNDKGIHVASISQERLFVSKNKPKF